MSIGASLELNQKQTVKLTPAQMQAVEILQMNSVELQQKINEELLENPVLDIGEASSGSPEMWQKEYLDYGDDSYDDKDRWDGSWSDNTSIITRDYRGQGAVDFEKYLHTEKTLHEHLSNQLMGKKCSDEVRNAAEIVIYSIDSSGYLEATAEELAEIHDIQKSVIDDAIRVVRDFDPQGIGYSTLQDCLKSQLETAIPMYEQICTVIDTMLNEVARGDIKSISRTVGVSQDQAAEICRAIRTLEPKPGMRYSDGSAIQYVVPDVLVELDHGRAYISIYGSQPSLTINEYYKNMYESSGEGEVKDYLKEKISRVNQLIDNIERRNSTIINVTRSILTHQEHFLNPGNRVLLPLTMQEVADDLGIHVSTVSRAVNGKYLMLAGSTYSLKYFFSTDVNGSSREVVVQEIKRIISEEDPAKPLSDQKISEILISKGYDISRRTVAKYRDAEGILPKSMRKR